MAFDPVGLTRDFGDIEGEARACRDDCALFDFSFMARARARGTDAVRAVEMLQPRPMADLAEGRIRYALRLTPAGTVAADLTVWRLADDTLEVMSGRHEDMRALAALAPAGTEIEDKSGASAILAIQGPGALEALAGIADLDALADLPYFGFAAARVADIPCLVGRLGYTGEKGFEIVASAASKAVLWHALAQRARPAGFAAADILRIEAGFMLFANECRLAPTPRELGLAAFAGDEVSGKPRAKLVCFQAARPERPILWRPSAKVALPVRPDEIAVTSACRSVAFDGTIGLGFVAPESAVPGIEVHDPDREFAGIRLAPLPLYDPGKRRPRGPWSRHRCLS